MSCPHADAAMSPKITGELLRQLRQAMRNCKYFSEPIQAYIVPSGDAHQVCKVTFTAWVRLLESNTFNRVTSKHKTYMHVTPQQSCGSLLYFLRVLIHFWLSPLTLINCSPLLLSLPSPCTSCDVRKAATVAFKMPDLVDGHFTLIVN